MREDTIRVTRDGNEWCALWGENLQEGVAGFGETQEAAVVALAQELAPPEYTAEQVQHMSEQLRKYHGQLSEARRTVQDSLAEQDRLVRQREQFREINALACSEMSGYDAPCLPEQLVARIQDLLRRRATLVQATMRIKFLATEPLGEGGTHEARLQAIAGAVAAVWDC